MSRYVIYMGERSHIEVEGSSLENAVRMYGKKNPKKNITCGLLVRVKDVSGSKIKPWTYWSGETFLECLG